MLAGLGSPTGVVGGVPFRVSIPHRSFRPRILLWALGRWVSFAPEVPLSLVCLRASAPSGLLVCLRGLWVPSGFSEPKRTLPFPVPLSLVPSGFRCPRGGPSPSPVPLEGGSVSVPLSAFGLVRLRPFLCLRAFLWGPSGGVGSGLFFAFSLCVCVRVCMWCSWCGAWRGGVWAPCACSPSLPPGAVRRGSPFSDLFCVRSHFD